MRFVKGYPSMGIPFIMANSVIYYYGICNKMQ